MANTTATRESRRESLRKSQVAEITALGYYAALGYRILLPLVDGEGYDFVAEKAGKFTRINVKVACRVSTTTHSYWRVSLCAGGDRNRSAAECVDVFLVWVPSPRNEFIELGKAEVAGKRSCYITDKHIKAAPIVSRNRFGSKTVRKHTGTTR